MIKKVLFILVLSLIFEAVGCDNSDNQQYSDNFHFRKKIASTSNRDIMPGTENLKGLRYRIYNDKGMLDNKLCYFLSKDDTWDKFISITHNFDGPAEYKLLLFIDFKQSNLIIDGKSSNDFNFKLNSNETIEIPVTINKLSKGLHDVLFLIVGNPNSKLSEKETEKNITNDHIMCLRFNISLDNNVVIPKYKLTNVEQKPVLQEYSRIIMNQSPTETNQPLLYSIKSSSNTKFFSHIPNNSNGLQKCAIIALQDWKQIYFDNSNVYFFNINASREAVIPLNINISNYGITSNLVSIVIFNPYEQLNKYNKQVLTSARLYLNIEPSK